MLSACAAAKLPSFYPPDRESGDLRVMAKLPRSMLRRPAVPATWPVLLPRLLWLLPLPSS